MNLKMKLVAVVVLVGVAGPASASDPSLTIYNQNFAVVRETVHLDLDAGVNEVSASGMTAHLEPSSVILRDADGVNEFRILEQNYRADAVSQELLLSLFEGETILFQSPASGGESFGRSVRGKIVRSGYSSTVAGSGYGSMGHILPLIEVNGTLQFGLPGKPIFPALGDNTILTPTLHWTVESEAETELNAELSYVTGQLSWRADYNLVLPEKGDILDLAGWVTIDNQSGKSFSNAKIKLMAGDVSKIRSPVQARYGGGGFGGGGGESGAPPVTEKTFDDYHLYTLERSSTLLDAQKKQVEFVRAEGVNSNVYYTYDGADFSVIGEWRGKHLNMDSNYGPLLNRKVAVTREFENTVDNQLGLPLPKGRLRVYRRDEDGRLEFTGENEIDHTPTDETIRINTGFAFDLVADRKRTHINRHNGSGNVQFTTDPATGAPIVISAPGGGPSESFLDESFEITLRNRKKEAVEIRVAEHLYRWANWEIQRPSDEFTKTDSQSIEFRVLLKPGEEKNVDYTVHYTWH